MADIKYEIVKKVAELSESSTGWTKEVNLVSWNEREPKVDIREWNHGQNKMSKGITLSTEELLKLKQALEEL